MLVDLHIHYPMHLLPPRLPRGAPPEAARERDEDRLRARIMGAASTFFNYRTPWSGPGVTVDSMRAGGVGVALSVLYSAIDELDVDLAYGEPPRPEYYDALVRTLGYVEESLVDRGRDAVIVRTPEALDDALTAGRLAVVHCVEGGFQIGATPAEIRRNVAALARRGVAYITLAHLFWRGVATNAPALPILPDCVYNLAWDQPPVGLTALGRAAVEAMVAHGVLIDVSHMTSRSLRDTFELLDTLDPQRTVPVLATHVACRMGSLEYNLTDCWIDRIRQRNGLVGLIDCPHYLGDGLNRWRPTPEQALDRFCQHVDRIAEVTRGHETAALGSDLDGFCKPTLPGLGDASTLATLEATLRRRYGTTIADALCSGNALRVLRSAWRRGL